MNITDIHQITERTVVLRYMGERKVVGIISLREATGLGLIAAKAAFESGYIRVTQAQHYAIVGAYMLRAAKHDQDYYARMHPSDWSVVSARDLVDHTV